MTLQEPNNKDNLYRTYERASGERTFSTLKHR